MADNILVQTDHGASEDTTISFDETGGGVKVQRVKIQHGVDGTATDASASNPLPVTGTMAISGTPAVTPATPTAYNLSSAATTNATAVKASAGTVYGITVSNANAAARYLKLYNKATAPTVGTDIPILTVPIPATGLASVNFGALGHRLATGIGIALTTGMAYTDTAAVALNEIEVTMAYI